MDDNSPVVLSKKGLDPEQVDQALGDVRSEIDRLETTRAEIDKRVDAISREIAEVRSALKRASSKPSFSDLGAAFEQTLRVAEEQAAKLLSDASVASAETRDAAQAEAEKLTTAAALHSQKLLEETEQKVARLRDDASKKNADLLRSAEHQVALADQQLAESQQLAAAIAKEGEQKRLLLESELAEEVDQSRNEIATLRQLHERDQRRITDEVDSARAKADRESARLAAENEIYISSLLEESQIQLDEANRRAREMMTSSQHIFGQARQEGVELVRDARETAAGIIRRARARVETLNERLEERTNVLIQAGEARVADIDSERDAVQAFNSELRVIALSEQILTEDEPSLPAGYELAGETEVGGDE